MFNKELRAYAKEKGVCFWQIAQTKGISEATMTRKLRTELSAEDKQNYINIIDELSKTNETTNDNGGN